MFPKPIESVEKCRVRSGMLGSNASFGNNGCFILTSPFRSTLQVIVSNTDGWDHTSVSPYRQKRTPTWEEMCWVKEQFWPDNEWVVQYHPSRDDYINMHPYCLHLWRPVTEVMPTPPSILVGARNPEEARAYAREHGVELTDIQAKILSGDVK